MKIKHKFALGFGCIFTISILIFNLIITITFENHMESLIKKDLTLIYNNSYKNIKYIFNLNGLKPEEDVFLRKSPQIAFNLSNENNCNIELYDIKGNLKYQYPSDTLSINEEEDTKLLLGAKDNKAVANIYKGDNYIVGVSSYGVYLENNFIGIVKISKDYTNLYNENKSFIHMLFIISFLALLMIFSLSYILTNRIIKPIDNLKNGFREVEKGNYDINMEVTSKDEIGELTNGFLEMKNKIKNQILKIEDEKQKVLSLQKSKTEFFNNATHELKTPLTIISGYSQIIGDKGFNDEEFKTMAIEGINRECQRMHEMVVSLLEISKHTTYTGDEGIEEVNMKELLENIIRDLSIKGDKYNLTIKCELSQGYINGNTDELRGIFINLIDNSIKYATTNSEIKIFSYYYNDTMEFCIENMSDPISDKDFSKIFEPFFKLETKRSKELHGSGLGLYICKQLVEKYQGTINVDYKENRFLVKVLLPRKKFLLVNKLATINL